MQIFVRLLFYCQLHVGAYTVIFLNKLFFYSLFYVYRLCNLLAFHVQM